MSTTAWIAGSVRARALSRRRVGAARARQIAACATTAEAVMVLVESPYGHDVHSGQDHAGAERGIGATLLWHLRVLAGWLPPSGVGPIRVLAGGFEMANIDEHLQRVQGRPAAPPYRLGALATAWNRLASTTSPDAMRHTLAASPWGDPGCSDPRGIAIGVRLGWAERVLGAVPAAERWAAGAVALLAAREVAGGRRLPDVSLRRAEALLGTSALRETTLSAFVAALPGRARWVFGDGTARFADLRRGRERGGAPVCSHRFLAAWRARAVAVPFVRVIDQPSPITHRDETRKAERVVYGRPARRARSARSGWRVPFTRLVLIAALVWLR